MRIFLTGGTGLIGSLLVKKMRERGDQVVALSRRPDAAKQFGDGVTVVVGDPVVPGPWMDAVGGCEAVVHLAGEGIFNRRWSQEFKDLIYSSRIKSTENIVAALAKSSAAEKSRVLVSGSAVGFYGPHGDEEQTEESAQGDDFLAKVCGDWEKAARPASVHGVRVVLLRTGVVLDKNGGALAKMLTPFKMCVGGPVGSGKQWMSWIHNADLCGLILHAIDHPVVAGPLNAVAPTPVTNREFGKALGKVLGRPSFFPTPGFILRVMLGESAQIVTLGQKVLAKKALATGYAFQFADVEAALKNLLGR